MEVVGVSFKCRTSESRTTPRVADNVLTNTEKENLSHLPVPVCRGSRERFHVFPTKRPNSVVLPTATAPRRGMIRLTALRGELENPRKYFNGAASIPSASSTGRLERMRKAGLRSISPEKRICGVSYTPESLQSFGRQVTMSELHRTVDNLIIDSTKRHDDGWNLPHIKVLDREVTRIIDSTERHLLYRQDLSEEKNGGNG